MRERFLLAQQRTYARNPKPQLLDRLPASAEQHRKRRASLADALRELHDQGLAETFFLANRVKDMTYGRNFAPATLIESWTAAKNARTTILVGDPT